MLHCASVRRHMFSMHKVPCSLGKSRKVPLAETVDPYGQHIVEGWYRILPLVNLGIILLSVLLYFTCSHSLTQVDKQNRKLA